MSALIALLRSYVNGASLGGQIAFGKEGAPRMQALACGCAVLIFT